MNKRDVAKTLREATEQLIELLKANSYNNEIVDCIRECNELRSKVMTLRGLEDA